jgi:hypothetical protein
MAHLMVRHKVEDIAKWKAVFDSHLPARKAAGLTDLHVWRNSGDPNEVITLFEVSDMAKAKEFAGSSDLKEKMQSGGVIGTPEIVFLSNA